MPIRWIAKFLVFLLAALLPQISSAEQNRFNVLFIAIDDLRPELGCYGVAEAQSPSLDRLARSAVLFERHFVQVATCGASRYAMLTGRSPANSQVTRNNAALYSGSSAIKPQQQAGAQTMAELFRRSGYHTVCLGKISHTPDGRVFAYNGQGDGGPELPGAWDELPTPFGPWQRGWGTFFAYAGGKHREDGGGHNDLMEFVAEQDDELPDGMLATAAIEQLRQHAKREKPLFLGLGFFKPHLPFVATRGDWGALSEVDIPLPPAGKPDSPYWHGSGEFNRYHAPFAKSQLLSSEAQTAARRAYYACVRYTDRQVGRVLAALDELGLAENTIVVVWGDHGWHLGEQQVWGKHTPWERANRSVLMIRAPGVSQPGQRTSALVESIDLYPTLVELCQPKFRQTHQPLDGTSLVPILTGQRESVREAALSYWGDAISVRTASHRLVVGKPKQGKFSYQALYDLSSDLDSMVDVSQQQPEQLSALRAYLPR